MLAQIAKLNKFMKNFTKILLNSNLKSNLLQKVWKIKKSNLMRYYKEKYHTKNQERQDKFILKKSDKKLKRLI